MTKYTRFISRIILPLVVAVSAWGQAVSISDTLTGAVGGAAFTGRITVTLSAPGSAQPLYYSTTSLTGWQSVYCVGVTGSDCTVASAAGVFAATLYANSTITPAGTSYTARYAPAKGAAWNETWVVSVGNTKLYEIRSTTVPTPTTTFTAGQLALAAGKILYGSAAGVATPLTLGTTGYCLQAGATAPEWGLCASGGGSGTVTSVGLALPSIFTVSGSPVTATGTLTGTLATQTANTIFSGPTTGSAATPTFRAIVDADIPNTITVDLAAAATALATARTIAGVSFDGTANIAIASTGLSDTADLVRNNAANTWSTGAQVFTAATLRVPNSTSLPVTCTVGDAHMDTNATSGARWYLCESTDTWAVQGGGGGGSGTVTSVSVVTANGVSGSVANATTTPAITLTLGAITPTTIVASGAVSGSNLSGTNTGDQTTITGNAGTATALAANGANCSGNLPRGVDASGAAEGCADVDLTTEVTGLLPTSNIALSTIRVSLINAYSMPDTSGNVWFEPYTITAATGSDKWGHQVIIYGNTGTDDILHGKIEVPQNFVSGAKVCTVWTAAGSPPSGDVLWGFAYRSTGGTSSLDDTAVEETVTFAASTAPGTAQNRVAPACVSLTDANIAAGDVLQFRAARNGSSGSDTMSASAINFGWWLEYQGR